MELNGVNRLFVSSLLSAQAEETQHDTSALCVIALQFQRYLRASTAPLGLHLYMDHIIGISDSPDDRHEYRCIGRVL